MGQARGIAAGALPELQAAQLGRKGWRSPPWASAKEEIPEGREGRRQGKEEGRVKPPDYEGPLDWKCPPGYIDLTTERDASEGKRRGVPDLDHPYYRAWNTIAAVVQKHPGLDPAALAEKIMEALTSPR